MALRPHHHISIVRWLAQDKPFGNGTVEMPRVRQELSQCAILRDGICVMHRLAALYRSNHCDDNVVYNRCFNSLLIYI